MRLKPTKKRLEKIFGSKTKRRSSDSQQRVVMPRRSDVIKAVQEQIDILIDSYTDRCGPDKGKIRDAGVRTQISRLQTAIAWLKAA